MFVHLHGHSHYSLLEGFGQPKNIIERAVKLKMNAIALTDIENMYGAIEFFEECKKNDIKPILGCELNFVRNVKFLPTIKAIQSSLVTLIAKNYEGYKNLIKLISIAQIENFFKGKAFIDLKILEKFNKNIFILIGGPNSLVGNLLNQNVNEKQIVEIIGNLKDIIGKENLLLEIQPQDPYQFPNYKKINDIIFNISKKLNLSLVVNNNFFYPSLEDKEVFGVLKAINKNEFFDPEIHIPKEIFHITSEEEIKKMLIKYNYLDSEKLIKKNFEISEQINIDIPLGQILFPKYNVAEETKVIYEKYKDNLIELH